MTFFSTNSHEANWQPTIFANTIRFHHNRRGFKRPSWRSAAQVSTSHLTVELAHGALIDSPFSCPWEDSSNKSVHVDNLATPGYQDDTISYLSFIRHLNTRFIIYTDGSATAGTLSGGVGMVVTEGDPASYYLIIRRRESGHAHGSRVALAISRSRGHLH